MANTALTPDKIADLVATTLQKAIRGSWKDISLDYQNFFFVDTLLKRMEAPQSGGQYLSWTIQHQNTGTAHATGLFDTDNLNVKDLAINARVDWAMQTANWIFDTREEDFNSGPERLVDYVAMRRHSMFNDFFKFMEEKMWLAGASTDDPRLPYGIPYWITKASLTSTFGFNGGNHASFSTGPGAIDRGTYANWKNGGATYVVLDDDDGLEKLSAGMDFCYFQAPDPHPEIAGGMPNWYLCTTHTTKQRLERLLRASNDNVGGDIGRWRGEPSFRSVPVKWLAVLTNSTSPARDTSNPIYGLNMKSWEYVFRSGHNQQISGPYIVADKHTVRSVHLDNTGQFRCLDPRSNFIIHEP
jgi:hypothetical protein